MPYKSKAQAAYFNIHRKELERQGVDVDEWNESSRGKKLPKHVSKEKTAARGDQLLKLLSSAGPMQMPREMGDAIEMIARKDIGMLKQMEPSLSHEEAVDLMDQMRSQRVTGMRGLNHLRHMRSNLDKANNVLDEYIEQLRTKQGMLDVSCLLKEAAPKLPKSYYQRLAFTNPLLHAEKSSRGGKVSSGIAKKKIEAVEREARIQRAMNPPPPPQMELGFDKQAYVLKDMDRVLYNHLARNGVNKNDDPEYVLNRKLPTKKDLKNLTLEETADSAGSGLYPGLLLARNLPFELDRGMGTLKFPKYSGRIGALLGMGLTGGAGYAYSKKKQNDYKKLTKKQKLEQINKFIKARKKQELHPAANPITTGASLFGLTAGLTAIGRGVYRLKKMDRAGGFGGKAHTSGTGENEKFTGSGNRGGGGKTEYKNPYTGEKADKYDKFMAMKRMAAEGETEGLRNNASAAAEKWKKKYKFASLLKIAKSMELAQLIKAKKMSDQKDYVHKNELLRKMLEKNPKAFKVDSHLNRGYVGITHIKSGFKIHAPKHIVPSSLINPQTESV
jgi:hypothetical protein